MVVLCSSEQSEDAQKHPSLGTLCSLCTAALTQRHMVGGQQKGEVICLWTSTLEVGFYRLSLRPAETPYLCYPKKSHLPSTDQRGNLMCPNLGWVLTLASKKCLPPLVGCKEAVTKLSELAPQELLATALLWQQRWLELCALSGRVTAQTPQFWRLVRRHWQFFH